MAFDNFFSTDEEDLAHFAREPNFDLVRGSVASSYDLARAFKAAGWAEAVFNLSAQSSSNPAAGTPEYTEETNLRGPRMVCEAARRYGAGRLVYASSTRVYGDPMPDVVTEQSPYGRFSDLSHLTKCYAEKLLEMHCAGGDLAGFTLRLGLVFGVSPVMKSDYRFMTAPNKFVLQAVRGERLTVNYGSWVGAVHVADAAAGLIFLAGLPAQTGYQVFNLAPVIVRIEDIAQAVAKEAGRQGSMTIIERDDAVKVSGCMPTIRSELTRRGFQATRTLDEGISETYRHFATRRSD